MSVPPGFQQLEIDGYKVFCEPAEGLWITDAIRNLQPATRPTTMPSDLLSRLQSQKAALAQRMAEDFAMGDPGVFTNYLDRLAAELDRLQRFSPPLFYLVTTQTRLKELVRSEQWTNPGFYYNRLADDVTFRETVALSVERPMDDTVMTCLFEAGDSPGQKQQRLQKLLRSTAAELDKMLSGRAMFLAQMTMAEAIQKEAFEPMKLPIDQSWLATGLAGAMSAEYASGIIGSPTRELLFLIASELKANPVRMRTIDLLHPADPRSLKRQYVALYADTYRRKCMSVALLLIEKSPAQVPALVKSMRVNPCTSGEELIKRIQEMTGVDVARSVAAE